MNIGIVGYGNIAKKHQAALSQIENATLLAVYDKLPIADNTIDHYDNLDQFLGLDHDLITICTPNGFHKKHSIAALEKNHHVICEKPLGLSAEDCKSMIATARAHEQKLFCTMQNRYSPVSQWLKSLVTDKSLGEIYLVNVACYWNRNKEYYRQSPWRGKIDKDGGTLFTQFSHYVDTIHWLFGNIKVRNGSFNNFDHGEMIEFEDTGLFNFTLDNGGMGTFSYTTSCYEKNFESSMTIIGSKGTVKVAGQYMDTVTYCNLEKGQQPDLPQNNNISNIAQVYKHAFDVIKKNDTELRSAHEALRVVETIEKVYKFRD